MDEHLLESSERLQEALMDNAIERIRAQKALPAKGCCYNCDGGFPPFSQQKFCNTDCREDYELREAAKRRAGLPT